MTPDLFADEAAAASLADQQNPMASNRCFRSSVRRYDTSSCPFILAFISVISASVTGCAAVEGPVSEAEVAVEPCFPAVPAMSLRY